MFHVYSEDIPSYRIVGIEKIISFTGYDLKFMIFEGEDYYYFNLDFTSNKFSII